MNVLKDHKRQAVETLASYRISQHEIHRRTGVDRKTIRRYAAGSKSPGVATGSGVDAPENPPPRPPAPETKMPKHVRSACESYREWIEEQVRGGRNAMAIYQDLVELFGFTHRYNSVKRFVRLLKRKDPEQYDRLEFLMGE